MSTDNKNSDWVFERSSGCAGWRNVRTGNWISNEDFLRESHDIFHETGCTPRELAEMVVRLQRSAEYENKYHELMDAIRRSQWEHGDCKSDKRYGGKPLACAACMAKLRLDEILESYKGRTVRLV